VSGKNDGHITTRKNGGLDLNQSADDLSEIDWYPWLCEQIGGCFVEPARRGDEPIQPIERTIDKADRALGALIVFGKDAPQWFEGLADDCDRRLEGVGIFFRRTPDLSSGAVQGVDHAVKLGADIGQLREASPA
jgi:hypothetical protein